MKLCEHERTEARKREGLNGAKVQQQCLKCLRWVGSSIPLSTFSQSAVEALDRGRSVSRPGRRRKAFLARFKRPDWKVLRKQVFERDGGDCVICGEPATDVDHVTYLRFGRERLSDLRSLCHDCHKSVTEGRL